MTAEKEQIDDLEGNDDQTTSPSKRKFCERDDPPVESREINKRRKSEANEPTTFNNNLVVKTEPVDPGPSDEVRNADIDIPINVKREPSEENNDATAGSSGDPTPSTTSNIPTVSIKNEPTDNEDASNVHSATSSNVLKTDPTSISSGAGADNSVSSSTLRPSCRFGIRCYRRNPAHRSTEAHPGDTDYRRPSFPEPPLGTPSCPYGNSCYRRNPTHFQQFCHPPDFNSAQNIRNRLRQRRAQAQSLNVGTDEYSDLDSDEEDPFHDQGDSDADYQPGAPEDDEDDDLEFDSQRQDCDEYD